jgi:hypothetical protein
VEQRQQPLRRRLVRGDQHGHAGRDLTGWKVDDSSNAFASAIALTGVSSIAPGQSVIFVEGNAATAAAFKTAWFGASVPAGFAIGSYSGSGIGLSTDGDAVNLFDATGKRITGVSFGASTTYFTFDNAAGLAAAISALSVRGVNGAFVAGGATAGLANDYLAATTATVTSTAGDAALSVVDPSRVAPGHLVNGTFPLPQALQVSANGGGYSPIAASATSLLAYSGPVSNDQVTIGLKQAIGAKDALRTGAYAKTLTFTLSTTTP